MQKNKRVYTQLCASCAEKMDKLYRLRETPPQYARGGYGKCGLCDFRGALTEYSYDPAEMRTAEENRRFAAEKSERTPCRCDRAAADEPRDYAFTADDFAALDAWDEL
jgi:hypothetical protein